MKNLGKFLGNSLLIWSLCLLSLLSLASIFYRTQLPMDGSELAVIQKNGLIFWAGLVVFALLLWVLIHFLLELDASHLLIGGFIFYAVVGLFLIFHQNNLPRHDALAVLEVARAVNRNEFSPLTSLNGYIFKYPHQLGLVTFERGVLAVFGQANTQVFFYINLLFALADNYLLYLLAKRQFPKTRVGKITVILSFLFLPQIFYILFVYGLTYSILFALLGLLFLQSYFQHRRLVSVGLALISVTVAYLLRSNNLLLLLSIVVVLFLDYLQNHYAKSLIVAATVLIVPMGASKLVTYSYQAQTGVTLEGEPKIAWVAMGLDDNPIYNRIPGWYDAYLETVYTEHQGNAKAIKRASQQKIKERIQYMRQNPLYTIQFFKNKFLSTWTDSLFQSVWSGPLPRSKVEGQKVEGETMASLYKGGAIWKNIYLYSAGLLTVIYICSIVGVGEVMRQRQGVTIVLVILTYLSAGFLFHLIWETKSQYVYPYIYMLLPLAALGVDRLYRRTKGDSSEEKI